MTFEQEVSAGWKAHGLSCNWWPEMVYRHQPDIDHPMVKRLSLDLKVKLDRFEARVEFAKKYGTYVDDEGYLTQFLVQDHPELEGEDLADAVRHDLDQMVPLSKLHQQFAATVNNAVAFRNRLNMVRMQ